MKQEISPAAFSALASGNLENMMAAMIPGGIVAQEMAWQATFVGGTSLPKEMLHSCSREKLERMGIKFGDDVDDIFVAAQLPDGWTKKATNHSMWSELLDEKGRRRADIFFKAAFYDRKAHISLCIRFSVSVYEPCSANGDPMDDCTATHRKGVVKDGDTVIHTVGICEFRDYQAADELERQGYLWLNEHYPEWRDQMAYWD